VSAAPRVLLADDHPALARAVKGTLEASGFDVCAEAATGPEAVAAALEERPDLCLLDVDMPGGGIAAARRIMASLPETAVVMLTVSSDADDLVEALRAGAVGYLLKDADPARLPLTLRAVLDGEAALPRTLVHHLVHEFQRTRGRRLSDLERQRQAGTAQVRPRGADADAPGGDAARGDQEPRLGRAARSDEGSQGMTSAVMYFLQS